MKIHCCILCLALVSVCITLSVNAQQFNNWYFGNNAGITFNGGTPIGIAGGQVHTDEGCATISDSLGNLLFYTDGLSVWNRNHAVMPNGSGLSGGSSSTQSATIVPDPSGASGIYYIVVAPQQFSFDPLTFSKVDMSLQGGLGDVTSLNISIIDSATESVAAIRHSNGQDIWFVTVKFGTNEYQSMLLTPAGFSPPVVSAVGQISNFIGYMKGSPCDDYIAHANWADNSLQLFDFNSSTGVLSNPVNLPIAVSPLSGVYGTEFSPDGTKLYASNITPALVYQYDLSSGVSATIIASRVLVGTSPVNFNGALQLGPDGKIYMSKFQDSALAVINDPNIAGLACGYIENGVALTATGILGLPDYIDRSLCSSVPPPVSGIEIQNGVLCQGDCISMTSLSQNATSWLWLLPGAVPATSILENPTNICYNTPGNFDVTLITQNSGGSDTLTIPVLVDVTAQLPVPVVTFVNDTLFSTTNPAYATYQWYLNGLPILNAFDPYYFPSVSGNYSVEVTNGGCLETGSLSVITAVPDPDLYSDFQILYNFDRKEIDLSFVSGITGDLTMFVFNATGQLIFKKTEFKSDVHLRKNISLPEYSSGVYLFYLHIGELTMKKKLFIR